jgi:hypothetical protein
MLPSESVHCGVTSPPYWGLRDYSACPCVPQERLGVFGDGRVDRHQPGGALAFHAQGTTGVVAPPLGRLLGVESNAEEYVAMARRRIAAQAPLLNGVDRDWPDGVMI